MGTSKHLINQIWFQKLLLTIPFLSWLLPLKRKEQLEKGIIKIFLGKEPKWDDQGCGLKLKIFELSRDIEKTVTQDYGKSLSRLDRTCEKQRSAWKTSNLQCETGMGATLQVSRCCSSWHPHASSQRYCRISQTISDNRFSSKLDRHSMV